ncbi:hypothetical protein [Paenibacillus sp. YIM B09110]|uniref:hypothetical protein n=1 Tax=Paenibacillus sp. YIM B09110 TaxID=3126102 RepID=UPI00301CCC22
MIIRINGEPSVMDRINDFADRFIEQETEYIVKPATDTLFTYLERFVDVINACSAEIITLGIVTCAVGLMVNPIVGGGGGNKWIGRLFITFWGGVIWRMIT